jgi:hypothetical protein
MTSHSIEVIGDKMYMKNGKMYQDDYERALEIAEHYGIDATNIDAIKLITNVPPKFQNKITAEHVRNLLTRRLEK